MYKYTYHTLGIRMTTVLFINKKRQITTGTNWEGAYCYTGHSSGLANSVRMVVDMLTDLGISTAVEEAIDNNCIDRLVSYHKPKVVIIEALWVIPSKFEILQKLHPTTTWYIRLHSEVSFIANEGMAMGWLRDYATMYPTVRIAANSKRMRRDMTELLNVPIAYMPNYYHRDFITTTKVPSKQIINISCFGAIRPLKNHLTQAIAAIKFADLRHATLRFHINGTRVEGNGGPILKNLRELFKASKHELVEHTWLAHNDFKQLIADEIDVGLQVSFTESYNIVAADHVDCNVPIVASPEVKFIAPMFTADPTSVQSIVDALQWALYTRLLRGQILNSLRLSSTNRDAVSAWVNFCTGI